MLPIPPSRDPAGKRAFPATTPQAAASAQRLLRQVAPPVCSQAALLSKRLPTGQAPERGFPGLLLAKGPPALEGPLVAQQQPTLAAEAFPALLAGAGGPVPVGLLLVLDPQGPLHKALLRAAAFGVGPLPALRPGAGGGVPLPPGSPAAVRSLVGQEEPLLTEALPAGCAGKGLLGRGVHPLVREQVLLEAEALPADAAAEGLLAGVDALVDDQVVLEAEAPAALRAQEGPLPRVLLLLVAQQAQRLAEALPAHQALVLLLLHLAVDDQGVLVPRALLPGGERQRPFRQQGAFLGPGTLLLLRGAAASWLRPRGRRLLVLLGGRRGRSPGRAGLTALHPRARLASPRLRR